MNNNHTPSAYRDQTHSSALATPEQLAILVANSKGGCGKTTIATNLASYFAVIGRPVSLLDLDPQQSSSQWLKQRAHQDIHGHRWPKDVTLTLGRLNEELRSCREIVIIDSPAGLDQHSLDHLLRVARVVLIPVLPSPIDIRATTRFVEQLLLTPAYRQRPRRLAVIANRTRQRTRMYQSLQHFLQALRIPYLATLRDTQGYVQGMSCGEGIMDSHDPLAEPDQKHWRLVGEWLEIQRHLLQIMPEQQRIRAVNSE